MPDVTFTVDGKKITAPAGTLLIDACKTAGIEIPAFRCPTCGGSDVEVASGNEFEVESIELAEPSAPLQDRGEHPAPLKGDLAGPEDSEKEEAECIAPR